MSHNYLDAAPMHVCILHGMVATSAEWLQAFTDLDGSPYVTNENVARALRAAGLFAKPSRGQGHRKTLLSATHLANFILAQAAPKASDAAEVVTNLRAMMTVGPVDSVLGDATLGEALDLMIAGFPGGSAFSSDAMPFQMPNEIHLSSQPYRADFIWLGPDGAPVRARTYLPRGSTGGYLRAVVRKTFIHHSVLELAGQMLAGTAEKAMSAAPGRAALDADRSRDERPKTHPGDRSDSLDSSDSIRGCVSLQPRKDRRVDYENEDCGAADRPSGPPA
jgi:hypothetical protein